MDVYTINYIKNNPLIYDYLRENSTWYKELNRDGRVIKQVEEEAKKFYKQTPEDKLKKLSRNIEMFKTFMDVIN